MSKDENKGFSYDKQDEWDFCSGDCQSPIDIETALLIKDDDSMPIKIDYDNSVTYVENNGHSIQAGGNGTAKINGRHFKFVQVHFHSTSEHTIDGYYLPIETHFVHQAKNGRIAVLGVMMVEGKENKGFLDLLNELENKLDSLEIDVSTMLPENKSYYHYLGSLTTPPLSENVEWYVMKNSVEISKSQIENFRKYYERNNRDIQLLNNRPLIEFDEN